MSTATDIPLLLDLVPSNSRKMSPPHNVSSNTQLQSQGSHSLSPRQNARPGPLHAGAIPAINIAGSNLSNVTTNNLNTHSTSHSSHNIIEGNGRHNPESMGRRRSNSQSQVVPLPSKPQKDHTFDHLLDKAPFASATPSSIPEPAKPRNHVSYYVTLAPLNDTFVKKHIPVAVFPETTKLGRPTATKNKPEVTNGYFESRVLSRTHAQLFIDHQGRLMLQDLGSSNGTFLNDVKLGADAVELKVNDFVCLGFNVQSESNHKQIILRIENINVIGGGASNELFRNHNSVQFKHLSFIEDIYNQINGSHENETKDSKEKKETDSKQLAYGMNIGSPPPGPGSTAPPGSSFDNALFGDINPTIEDSLLGIYSPINAGIYNNAQVTNNYGVFENFVNSLVNNLHVAKRQSELLKSLEIFFQNYKSSIVELNSKYLDERFKSTLDELRVDIKKNKSANSKLKEKCKVLEQENSKQEQTLKAKASEAEHEIDDLKYLLDRSREESTRLQLELVAMKEQMKQQESAAQATSIEPLQLEAYPEPSVLSSTAQNDDRNASILLSDLMNHNRGSQEGDNTSVHSGSSVPGSITGVANMNFKISTSANKPKTTTQDSQVEVHGLFSDLPKIGNKGVGSSETLSPMNSKAISKDQEDQTSNGSIQEKEDAEEKDTPEINEKNETTSEKEESDADANIAEAEVEGANEADRSSLFDSSSHEHTQSLEEEDVPDIAEKSEKEVRISQVISSNYSSGNAMIVAVLVAVIGSMYVYARSQ